MNGKAFTIESIRLTAMHEQAQLSYLKAPEFD